MKVLRYKSLPSRGFVSLFSRFVLFCIVIYIQFLLLNSGREPKRRLLVDTIVLSVISVIVLILVFLALSGIRVVQQYERGVIFVLGSLRGAKGPGIFWVPPIITRMIKVDLRIVTLTVPPQEVISRDNVTIKVTAVLYFYVVDPNAAVVNVMNFIQATTQIGQTTLRNVLGQSELDELIWQRD